MNDKKEKLDILLEQNTAEQMAKVDFDQLNTAISKRLDQIDHSRTTTRKGPVVFKFAAGLAAAAAILLILLMVDTQKPVAPKGSATDARGLEDHDHGHEVGIRRLPP